MPIPLDPNNKPVVDPSWALTAEKVITFDGGTANAIGDHDGTGDPFTIFTVTGTVKVRIFAVVETTLVGAATLEVGFVGATAALLSQLADATVLAAGEIWHDGTPDAFVELATVAPEKVVAAGKDIIGTVGTANITAGVLRFICAWYPLSADGKVEAA